MYKRRGLVGNLNRNRTVSFQIVDSYVNAYIWGVCTNGSSQCGGFIGHITGDNFKHAEISRCYATGNLDARNKAGLICWQQNASRETVIADCRYDREKLNLKDKQFACSLGSFSTDWHTSQLFNCDKERLPLRKEYRRQPFHHPETEGERLRMLF